MYVWIYIYVCIHVCLYKNTYMIYIHIHYMQEYIHKFDLDCALCRLIHMKCLQLRRSYMHACMQLLQLRHSRYVCVYVFVLCVYVCMYVFMCDMYTHTYVYVYVCFCVCICIHTCMHAFNCCDFVIPGTYVLRTCVHTHTT